MSPNNPCSGAQEEPRCGRAFALGWTPNEVPDWASVLLPLRPDARRRIDNDNTRSAYGLLLMLQGRRWPAPKGVTEIPQALPPAPPIVDFKLPLMGWVVAPLEVRRLLKATDS